MSCALTCREARSAPEQVGGGLVPAEPGVALLEEALARVERMLGTRLEWTRIEDFLPDTEDGEFRKSALASSFVAALELARKGKVRLDQKGAFEPLFIRAA